MGGERVEAEEGVRRDSEGMRERWKGKTGGGKEGRKEERRVQEEAEGGREGGRGRRRKRTLYQQTPYIDKLPINRTSGRYT